MATEAQLTSRFLQKARIWYAGLWAYKINDRIRAGVPDSEIIYGGRHIFVEFKKAPYTVTDIQRVTFQQMANAGARIYVVTFYPDRLTIDRWSHHGVSLAVLTTASIDVAVRFVAEA